MTFYARVTSYSNRGSDQDLDVVTTHLCELTRHPLSGLARELRAYQAISGQEISRFVHARPSIITQPSSPWWWRPWEVGVRRQLSPSRTLDGFRASDWESPPPKQLNTFFSGWPSICGGATPPSGSAASPLDHWRWTG